MEALQGLRGMELTSIEAKMDLLEQGLRASCDKVHDKSNTRWKGLQYLLGKPLRAR